MFHRLVLMNIIQTGRWYPSACVLSNGSVVVVGGETGSNAPANPTLEILPRIPGGSTLLFMDWLNRTNPNNLYPFLHILPSGKLFAGESEMPILLSNYTDVVRQATTTKRAFLTRGHSTLSSSFPICQVPSRASKLVARTRWRALRCSSLNMLPTPILSPSWSVVVPTLVLPSTIVYPSSPKVPTQPGSSSAWFV